MSSGFAPRKRGRACAIRRRCNRIDPTTVKTEALAAGFVLEAESSVLRNPADDHTKKVFDSSVRGVTDQFVFRFRKPGERSAK